MCCVQAKKTVETQLAEAVDDEQRRERSGRVVSTITDCLNGAPKEENAQYNLMFDAQNVNLSEVRGCVCVGWFVWIVLWVF